MIRHRLSKVQEAVAGRAHRYQHQGMRTFGVHNLGHAGGAAALLGEAHRQPPGAAQCEGRQHCQHKGYAHRDRMGSVSSTFSEKVLEESYRPPVGLAAAITEQRACRGWVWPAANGGGEGQQQTRQHPGAAGAAAVGQHPWQRCSGSKRRRTSGSAAAAAAAAKPTCSDVTMPALEMEMDCCSIACMPTHKGAGKASRQAAQQCRQRPHGMRTATCPRLPPANSMPVYVGE